MWRSWIGITPIVPEDWRFNYLRDRLFPFQTATDSRRIKELLRFPKPIPTRILPHPNMSCKMMTGKEETVPGDNLWIGGNVIVLPGVPLGDNAVIGGYLHLSNTVFLVALLCPG